MVKWVTSHGSGFPSQSYTNHVVERIEWIWTPILGEGGSISTLGIQCRRSKNRPPLYYMGLHALRVTRIQLNGA